ncbi:hypothetical protein [Geobacillus sp. B4113_201601]|nr:hypothetical protein [Geobacillus sp. B4113_201601]
MNTVKAKSILEQKSGNAYEAGDLGKNTADPICFSIRETLHNQLSFLNEHAADSCVTAVFHQPSMAMEAENVGEKPFVALSDDKLNVCFTSHFLNPFQTERDSRQHKNGQ